MMENKSHAEKVRQALANQFYQALVALGDDRLVTVDFSKIPRVWRFAIPQGPTVISDAPCAMINALDLIERTVPGMWGYAEAAGMRNIETCTRCGKCFDKKTGKKIDPL